MRHFALLLLAACGWSEKKFEVEGIGRLCDAASACAGTYDAATCVDHLRVTDRSKCDYDPGAARDCGTSIEDAQCVQIEPFDLYELQIPDDCLVVYDCEWIDLSAL